MSRPDWVANLVDAASQAQLERARNYGERCLRAIDQRCCSRHIYWLARLAARHALHRTEAR